MMLQIEKQNKVKEKYEIQDNRRYETEEKKKRKNEDENRNRRKPRKLKERL